jgi:hypothetical protein
VRQEWQVRHVLAVDLLRLAWKTDQQVPHRVDTVAQAVLEEVDVLERRYPLVHQLQGGRGQRLDPGLDLSHPGLAHHLHLAIFQVGLDLVED